MDSILKLVHVTPVVWYIWADATGLPGPIADLVRQYAIHSPQMLLQQTLNCPGGRRRHPPNRGIYSCIFIGRCRRTVNVSL